MFKPTDATAEASEADDACSGYQSTDFQTAYEIQSNFKIMANSDSISENDKGAQ